MAVKRILFYLEPITYANSPLRLSGWLNFFSQFADRSKGYFSSHLAAAPTFCSLDQFSFESRTSVAQPVLLRSAKFDRAVYSRDLCSGWRYTNGPLLRVLRHIDQAIRPDIVISVTDNRYLKRVFGPKVSFMELGPLPRFGMRTSVFVDPYGHQIGSAIDQLKKSSWQSSRSFADFAEIWRHRWLDAVSGNAESCGLADWLRTNNSGKKILLAALQPADWITYEGISTAPDPVSFLRKLADMTDDSWMVLPQWHPSDTPPSDELMDELVRTQPNIMHVPPQFRAAQSEPLIPFVDGVATISSNVAALGAITGKKLYVHGRSKFKSFETGNSEEFPRPDLLAFLASRYCCKLDDFLNIDGAFAEHALKVLDHPNALFDPTGITVSQFEEFFS